MASTSEVTPSAILEDATGSKTVDQDRLTSQNETPTSSNTLEMSQSQTEPAERPAATQPAETEANAQSIPESQERDTSAFESRDAETTAAGATEPVAPTSDSPKITSPSDESAIGPSNDSLVAVKADADLSAGPVVMITLLLITGGRHPFKIDGKYLRKRNIMTDEKADPFKISVYTMKELILRDWRDEWEQKPLSPSAIRLIHFGKLLDDKSLLKDCRFDTVNPNVVHMTIKPQDAIDEEEAAAKLGKGSGRDAEEQSRVGCRCVIL